MWERGLFGWNRVSYSLSGLPLGSRSDGALEMETLGLMMMELGFPVALSKCLRAA